MATANVGARVPESLEQQLQTLAEGTGRTVSYLVQCALEEYVERESWKVEEIRRALEEANAGDFATGDEVAAVFGRWADEE